MDILRESEEPFSIQDVLSVLASEPQGTISLLVDYSSCRSSDVSSNRELQARHTCSEVRAKWPVKKVVIMMRKMEQPGDGSPLLIVGASANNVEDATAAVQHIAVSLTKVTKSEASLVQVRATNDELNRRISAFMARKRAEVDQSNVREFCRKQVSDENSCARTEAVMTRRKDSKSHVRVTRVVNPWGPQTRGVDPGSIPTDRSDVPATPSVENNSSFVQKNTQHGNSQQSESSTNILTGLDERFRNLEDHLQIRRSGPVPLDIYARLKAIEERVLYLEGLSPEYFGHDVLED